MNARRNYNEDTLAHERRALKAKIKSASQSFLEAQLEDNWSAMDYLMRLLHFMTDRLSELNQEADLLARACA